jgi:hypothetical protein
VTQRRRKKRYNPKQLMELMRPLKFLITTFYLNMARIKRN